MLRVGRPAHRGNILVRKRLVNGRYRLLEQIGAGGRGVVFRARDEATGEPVALKVLDPGAGGDLRGEFACLAALDHPGIVRVLDYGDYNPTMGKLTFKACSSLKIPEFVLAKWIDEILPDKGTKVLARYNGRFFNKTVCFTKRSHGKGKTTQIC